MPLPKEITDLIGKVIVSTIYEVEEGAIARFAEAVDDPNPLYWDEAHARESRHGSIIAPPGFFGWPVKRSGEPEDRFLLLPALAKAGYSRILDGGIEWEFFSPVRAGDRLKVETTLKNIVERSGKTGKTVFMIRETKYTREDGEMVATERHTTIHPAS
ncbi:MAG: MaoC family dehydratase N-terminal domain-containing protein [Chloroflexi bacterium]|nr:MaoC family dehydratase N-terminal domain-containing protein [Chloroflexota bacterium]